MAAFVSCSCPATSITEKLIGLFGIGGSAVPAPALAAAPLGAVLAAGRPGPQATATAAVPTPARNVLRSILVSVTTSLPKAKVAATLLASTVPLQERSCNGPDALLASPPG